jgi:hypothetical protein
MIPVVMGVQHEFQFSGIELFQCSGNFSQRCKLIINDQTPSGPWKPDAPARALSIWMFWATWTALISTVEKSCWRLQASVAEGAAVMAILMWRSWGRDSWESSKGGLTAGSGRKGVDGARESGSGSLNRRR